MPSSKQKGQQRLEPNGSDEELKMVCLYTLLRFSGFILLRFIILL